MFFEMFEGFWVPFMRSLFFPEHVDVLIRMNIDKQWSVWLVAISCRLFSVVGAGWIMDGEKKKTTIMRSMDYALMVSIWPERE